MGFRPDRLSVEQIAAMQTRTELQGRRDAFFVIARQGSIPDATILAARAKLSGQTQRQGKYIYDGNWFANHYRIRVRNYTYFNSFVL